MRVLKRILWPRGRLSRGAFWLRTLIAWAVFALLATVLAPWLADGGALVWILNLPVLWALVCASAQRLHDRNFGGLWLVLAAVPVLGALWLVWQLAVRRGAEGANRWGADPRARTADFLVVR